MAAVTRLWSSRCAVASVRRYETAAGERSFSWWCVVAAAASPRSWRIASASGGCGSVTTTSVERGGRRDPGRRARSARAEEHEQCEDERR